MDTYQKGKAYSKLLILKSDINDTALKGKRKIRLDGYFSYEKNREKNKGGVATVIKNNLKGNSLKVKDSGLN